MLRVSSSLLISVGCLCDDSRFRPPFWHRTINALRMFGGYERFRLSNYFTSGCRDTWCIGFHVSIDGDIFHQCTIYRIVVGFVVDDSVHYHVQFFFCS